MGWSYGIAQDGREIGYAVQAECDYPDCHKKIDRGLAYACGNNHEAGNDYCAGYFCYEHLQMTPRGQRCPDCATLIPDEEVGLRFGAVCAKGGRFILSRGHLAV